MKRGLAGKWWAAALLGALVVAGRMPAQMPEPGIPERMILNAQAARVFGAFKPAVERVAPGTVEVRVSDQRVGYGMVVAPQKVLAKWSEVRAGLGTLGCLASDGKWRPARVDGIYREEDLAVMTVEGLEAQPLVLQDGVDVELG